MTCCQTTYKTFSNVSQTILPWSGNRPTVSVSYLVDGVWMAMGVQTVINIFNGGDPNAPVDVPVVVVDHGGPATGVVKMVQ